MRIGILGYEYFGIKFEKTESSPTSAHGGFGFLTKQKAEYLVKMGHEVHVFIPASSYDRQNNVDNNIDLNGVHLHLYRAVDKLSEGKLKRLVAQFSQHWIRNKNLDRMLAKFPVDIYQSEEPGLFTNQSLRFSKNQLVIFQDPYDMEDFRIMGKAFMEYMGGLTSNESSVRREPSKLTLYLSSKSRNYVKELLQQLKPNMVYAEALFIATKVRKMYNLEYTPGHLVNPIEIPNNAIKKSEKPSVVWVGRWDPQKRPDIALAIASTLPDVDFFFIGKATEYEPFQRKEETLKRKYSSFANIHFEEFVSEDKKKELIGRAWILLNTSVREGIPATFLEAMSQKTCIVSDVDPDNYTSNFGVAVENGDYVGAIKKAIENNLYKDKGQKGYEHALAVHEIGKVMKRHVELYEEIISLNNHSGSPTKNGS